MVALAAELHIGLCHRALPFPSLPGFGSWEQTSRMLNLRLVLKSKNQEKTACQRKNPSLRGASKASGQGDVAIS